MSAKKKAASKNTEAAKYPKVFTSFQEPSLWGLCINNSPTCGNGIVSVRQYRITIELVDEPVAVIAERLQKLWEESDNIHHSDPIRREASKYGVDLSGSRGAKVKRGGA